MNNKKSNSTVLKVVLYYLFIIIAFIFVIAFAIWERKLDIEYKLKIINQSETITNITEKVH